MNRRQRGGGGFLAYSYRHSILPTCSATPFLPTFGASPIFEFPQPWGIMGWKVILYSSLGSIYEYMYDDLNFFGATHLHFLEPHQKFENRVRGAKKN